MMVYSKKWTCIWHWP